jgi:hypothetical protein
MATIRVVYKDGSESVHENFILFSVPPDEYVLQSDDKKIIHRAPKANVFFINVTVE